MRGVRPEQQARNDEQGGERETSGEIKDLRRERRQIADASERPRHARSDRRDGKPAPQLGPGEREGGGGDDGQIEIERPIVRRFGRDDQRRQEGADHTETRERGAVKKGGGKREERDRPEEHRVDDQDLGEEGAPSHASSLGGPARTLDPLGGRPGHVGGCPLWC